MRLKIQQISIISIIMDRFCDINKMDYIVCKSLENDYIEANNNFKFDLDGVQIQKIIEQDLKKLEELGITIEQINDFLEAFELTYEKQDKYKIDMKNAKYKSLEQIIADIEKNKKILDELAISSDSPISTDKYLEELKIVHGKKEKDYITIHNKNYEIICENGNFSHTQICPFGKNDAMCLDINTGFYIRMKNMLGEELCMQSNFIHFVKHNFFGISNQKSTQNNSIGARKSTQKNSISARIAPEELVKFFGLEPNISYKISYEIQKQLVSSCNFGGYNYCYYDDLLKYYDKNKIKTIYTLKIDKKDIPKYYATSDSYKYYNIIEKKYDHNNLQLLEKNEEYEMYIDNELCILWCVNKSCEMKKIKYCDYYICGAGKTISCFELFPLNFYEKKIAI
jgi:hypothetical protein